MRNFNPQVPPLGVVGRPPHLSGGAVRGLDGNAIVVPAWDPQKPLQAPAAQLGGGYGAGAQTVPMARPAMAQAQPQQPQYQQQYQPQPQQAQDEVHKFMVQAFGRNNQPFTANLTVPFPQGTRILGYLPPRPPAYGMGGQEETHVFTIRGIDSYNREHYRDIEVTFPAGVSQPVVSEV
jgi:hypothetical protein